MSDNVVSSSQKRLWFLIPLIVFIGLIVMLFFRLGKPTEVEVNSMMNKPVPTFELPLLTPASDNTQLMSNADLPKSPYLINVWGSWCPTCVVEHPFLMQLHQQGVQLIGVNYQDELENALNYLQDGGDPFLFSVRDYEGSLAIDLGLKGAPETFVVDAQGNIRQHILGELAQSNWDSQIKPCWDLLNELSGSQNNNPNNDQNNPQVDTTSPEVQSRIAEVCK